MLNKGIINKIAKSRVTKVISLILVFELIFNSINPLGLYALTTGPTQPEAEGFQPIGVTDMVDPFTGDFSYNIPLMQIGDYPLNLAYQSGVGMEDEASWVGLGWNVHTGVINRQLRGIPDDFWGDVITRKVNLKDNITVGAKVMLGFETFGLDLSDMGVNLGAGIDASYNNYTGFGLGTTISAGLGPGKGGAGLPLNLGLSMSSGPDGLNISPNISFSKKFSAGSNGASGVANIGFGMNINSRSGMSAVSLNASASLKGGKYHVKYVKPFTISIQRKAESSTFASFGSTISLGSPTYTPKIDLPMHHFSASGRFKIGAGTYGQDIDATITGYGSVQKLAKNILENPSFGYAYSEKGNGNDDAIHDFNREKDGTFNKEKKNLALVNYTHDIFSIAAQGLGGSFRAYRNDIGHLYDKKAFSPSESIDFGLELGPGQVIDLGLDFTTNILESESKRWSQSNAAAQKLKFRSKEVNDIRENFHFKLTGEMNVDTDPTFINNIRNKEPLNIDLDDDKSNFEVASYNKFVNKAGQKFGFNDLYRSKRQQRNTAIYHLTKDQILRAYPWKAKNISSHAKGHHIAEVVVVQPDGKRYIFGLAAYNSIQIEQSFNVGKGGQSNTFVNFDSDGLSLDAENGYLLNTNANIIDIDNSKRGVDHFYEETITPAYVHGWMLTEVLSADYVDVTGDGPTKDDLGNYTLFNYGSAGEPNIKDFPWRTPSLGENSSTYMEGLRTDPSDDKASIIFGKKDIWYVHSIESKTQIAIFNLEDREDALGSYQNGSFVSIKKLKRLNNIQLFSKYEYDLNPTLAVPIKTVHFIYDYLLCPDTPNSTATDSRKLTLTSVYFTYKNSKEGQFSPYKFEYKTHSSISPYDEFSYKFGDNDRWGIYKTKEEIPSGLSNLRRSDYPYANQDKAVRDDHSSAWHLNKITVPSGAQINVDYESDDYAYVQDKPAMRMFQVLGFGNDSTDTSPDNHVYTAPLVSTMKKYMFVKIDPDPEMVNSSVFRQKYLIGKGDGNYKNNPLSHLYFRILSNANSGIGTPDYEFVFGYADILSPLSCGLVESNHEIAYLELNPVSTKIFGTQQPIHPFAFAAWQFSRLYTPRKAYNQPEPGDATMSQIIQILAAADMLSQLVQFFQGPNGRMLGQGYGSKVDTQGSWVRLLEPDKTKLGGGNRVKKIQISDNWNEISPSESSAVYGQEFSYINDEGITSGVAAYEPNMGADENAFRVPVFYAGAKHVLIPDEQFYLEEPFGESFFPTPTVGYSQITVKDIGDPNVTINRTGKTVHKFYTAFDFPTSATHTFLNLEPRKSGVLGNLLGANTRDYMTATQGYTVTLNDMHGKKKSIEMYAEGESAPFSSTIYKYKTQGDELDNKMDVIDKEGNVSIATIGEEIDLATDMREQSTNSETISVTGNLASMIFGTIPAIIPTIFGSFKRSRTRFRSAVTTKVVYQFGIQDETITNDRGAIVTTKITALDGETGAPIVQQLTNEFKDKYYKTDYPAHWFYSGMDQASDNIGYTFSVNHINSTTGELTDDYLEPGDEVLPLNSVYKRNVIPWLGNANSARLWVSKHEADGKLYLINNLGLKYIPNQCNNCNDFTVIRSGHRNQQSTSTGSVTSILNPIVSNELDISNASKVIAASAVEFSEHWKTKAGFLKPVNDTSAFTIEYDHKVLAFINIMNAIISHYGSIEYGSVLTDYLNINSIAGNNFSKIYSDCETADVNYHGHALSSCYTPPSFMSITGQTHSNFGGSIIANTRDYENCICNFSFGLTPIEPCTTFTSSDWADIHHFNSTISLNPSQSPDYEISQAIESSGTYSQENVVISAVMNDLSVKNFVLHSNCIDFENIYSYFITTSYSCVIDEGTIINPYIYGILGNWRPIKDHFFMGDRNNTDASTSENLRRDGYITNFIPYWSQPSGMAAYWSRNSSNSPGAYNNWSWKSEMTIYSPYGYDLENSNPLPAFTGAQYGYQNTLPTATANNAMQKEIGFDSFEDYYPLLSFQECEREFYNHFYFFDFVDNITQSQAHTGLSSMKIPQETTFFKEFPITDAYTTPQARTVPYVLDNNDLLKGFSPNKNMPKKYILCFWAKTNTRSQTLFDYSGIEPDVKIGSTSLVESGSLKKSKIIADWQRYELIFNIPDVTSSSSLKIQISNAADQDILVDDIRVHPYDANMKSFVYHMYDLRYMAQLDENNFATFYEYDEAGKLVRTKKETERGIMTLQENRSNTYKHP